MSDDADPDGTAQRRAAFRRDYDIAKANQRHPYAGHPAALVLADHRAPMRGIAPRPVMCTCAWIGPECDHAAHLAEVLHRAGLLADGPPPETLTERILAERAQRRAT